MKVLSFGEILWDVYPDKKYIGGAPLNFAAHLAKHGEESYMLSALGNDDLGKDAENQLKIWNISTRYVSHSDTKDTGKCLVTLDENSIPSYNLLEDVAYDYITCDNIYDTFDVLYFGTLSLRSEYNYNSLKQLLECNTFKEIFVDVNIRPPFYSDKTVKFATENATILKVSLEELPIVEKILEISLIDYKHFAKELANKYKNLKCIIITLGADGAYVLDCISCKEYSCGCEETKVASTVGAGDSFSAAFLYQYFKNTNIKASLEYATKIAGYVVSNYDAVPDYDVNDFL